jgi:hypothetical protein
MMKFTKKRVSFLLVHASVTLLLLSSLAQASKDDLLKIAVDKLVNGWSAAQDSASYAGPDRLQDIYDGGYEVYVKAGVTEALRKMYARGNDFVEVTVHTMKSVQAARSFLAARHKMETGKDAPIMPVWNRFVTSGAGSTTVYLMKGRYFITVIAYYDGDKGKQQTAEIAKSLEDNAAKLIAGRK